MQHSLMFHYYLCKPHCFQGCGVGATGIACFWKNSDLELLFRLAESKLFWFLGALFYTKFGLHGFGVGVAGVAYLGLSRSRSRFFGHAKLTNRNSFFRYFGVGVGVRKL